LVVSNNPTFPLPFNPSPYFSPNSGNFSRTNWNVSLCCIIVGATMKNVSCPTGNLDVGMVKADKHAVEVEDNDTHPHRSFHNPPLVFRVVGVHSESGVTAWNRRVAIRRQGYRRVNASDWISQALVVSFLEPSEARRESERERERATESEREGAGIE
jgi:hypothetical protein